MKFSVIALSAIFSILIFFPCKTSFAQGSGPPAAFIMTYEGMKYYVIYDRVDVSDIDPENIFELYLGVVRADGMGKPLPTYRLRFYRENSVWYYRIDEYYGNFPIKGTVYELIFNFCRARYF